MFENIIRNIFTHIFNARNFVFEKKIVNSIIQGGIQLTIKQNKEVKNLVKTRNQKQKIQKQNEELQRILSPNYADELKDPYWWWLKNASLMQSNQL